MKVRRDFVTNSSSSSFIISKKCLSQEQIEKIYAHDEQCKDELDFPWSIKENRKYITGYVFMDNFSMYDYLKSIGVNMDTVEWDEYEFDLDGGVIGGFDNED